MRRALVPVLVVVVFALTIPAAATTESGNYKDRFDSIGWGGSNGSLSWSGPWVEFNDDGDEKFGSVRVASNGNCDDGNCIQINPLTTVLGQGVGVSRSADTSVFENMELCFDLKATGGLASQLFVEVDAGSGWETVKSYNLGAVMTDHPTIDISDYGSEDFEIRFRYTGVLLGSAVYIDNVEISGDLIAPTTTTTTAPTTTTTAPTTTTTRDEENSTTTTTIRATTTTRPTTTTTNPESDSSTTTTVAGSTTTTSPDDTTSTTLMGGGGGGGDDGVPPGSDGGPEGSGIRQTARGLQANFDAGLFGEVSPISPITGVDFQARFSMAAEIIETSWAWIVLLALVIAWSIVSGMERRRVAQPAG